MAGIRIVAAGVIGAALAIAASLSKAEDVSYSQVGRGKYLVDAGDCVACHTNEKGREFAGGRPVPTPFGTIYSANITPDRETGIGAWSDEEFYRAMHLGVRSNGKRLYPAFPYTYFTKMTREDVKAIRAYLRTLKPINNTPPPPAFYWPLNYRVMMGPWDWIFFRPGEFHTKPDKSADWNRGAYLVEGPGHCGACHTPKNVMGADKKDAKLEGYNIQGWFAPKLAADKHNGLGRWSVDDIAEYLKTGRNKYSGATGLMAEVVQHSTSKLDNADVHAIAVYLADVAGGKNAETKSADANQTKAGEAIFKDSCSGCHQASGEGVPHMFPPLKGNANVQSEDPSSIIRVIVEGARTIPTDARPTPSSMPAYGWKLSNEQVAAVATYVRNAWGNAAPPVSASDVGKLKKDLASTAHAPPGEAR